MQLLLLFSLILVVSQAGGVFKSTLMNEKLRQAIVDAHNSKRQLVASGQQTQFPSASYMKVINYDMSLESLAMNWAKTCPDGHNPERKVTGITTYIGENLHFSWTSEAVDLTNYDMTESVTGWYNEVTDCPVSLVDSFQRLENVVVGHFTQVIWAESVMVGCAVSHCEDVDKPEFPSVVTVVCNYSPGGNMLDNPIYIAGDKCSSPDCTCNAQFDALCGRINAVPSETITDPSSGNASTEIKPSSQVPIDTQGEDLSGDTQVGEENPRFMPNDNYDI